MKKKNSQSHHQLCLNQIKDSWKHCLPYLWWCILAIFFWNKMVSLNNMDLKLKNSLVFKKKMLIPTISTSQKNKRPKSLRDILKKRRRSRFSRAVRLVLGIMLALMLTLWPEIWSNCSSHKFLRLKRMKGKQLRRRCIHRYLLWESSLKHLPINFQRAQMQKEFQTAKNCFIFFLILLESPTSTDEKRLVVIHLYGH